ncbi:hypothetical protein A0U94_14745 (plasmid) [Gluconobacter albidus]|nr:hypothetical protein A0U94_14745 [Gluconobacter albidus]
MQAQQRAPVKLCWTRISFHQLLADDLPSAAEPLSTDCFSCRLSLAIRGIEYQDNAFAKEAPLGESRLLAIGSQFKITDIHAD